MTSRYITVLPIALAAIVLIMACLLSVYLFCPRASAEETTSPIAITANTQRDTVSVIDMDNGTVFGTVFNISSPTGVAIDGNDSRLFVTNGEDNTVTVVDLKSYEAVYTIGVGVDPSDIAISPDDGEVYVANKGSNSLSIINTTNFEVTSTLAIGTQPSAIEVNPVSGDVYVSNAADGEVWVIRDDAKATTIVTGSTPVKCMAVTPDGSQLLVVAQGNNSVEAFNTSTFKAINTVGVGLDPDGIDVYPNGLYAFVSNLDSGNISIMQLSDSSIRVSFKADSPGEIALRPSDGRMAYVLSVPSGNVTEMDSATGEVKAVLDIGATSIRTALVNSDLLEDTIPPVTTIHIAGVRDDSGSFIGRADCTLTAIDYPSGTADSDIQYSLNGLTWLPYNGGNITFATPGDFYLYYRAEDASGNIEPVRSSQIAIVAGTSAATPTPGPATILPPGPTVQPSENVSANATVPEATEQTTPLSTATGGFQIALAAIGISCAAYLIYRKK